MATSTENSMMNSVQDSSMTQTNSNGTKPPMDDMETDNGAPDTLSASTPPKAAILRPALRGILKRKGDLVVWEGQWGMDDNAFDGGIISDFGYIRDNVHDSQESNDVGSLLSPGDDADLYSNATFSGHFFMSLNGKKKKVTEKNVVFEFSRDESLPNGTVKVIGSGTNLYGYYSLEGTLVLATGALNLYREYKYDKPTTDIRRAAAARRPTKSKTATPAQRKSTTPAAAVQRKQSRASIDSLVSGPDAAIINSLAKNPPRMRRAPSHLTEDAVDDRAQQNLIKIKGIVRDVMRSDKEGWFHMPVDAVGMGLTTYHDIIKEPMDLGTVMKNLDNRVYVSHEDASRDVRLTFENAMTFNPPANGVHQSAKRLLSMFENQLKKLVKNKSRKRKSVSTSSVGGGSTSGALSVSGAGSTTGTSGKGLKRNKSEDTASGAGPTKKTMSDLFSSDEEDNDDDDDMSDDGDITAGVTSAPAKKRTKSSIGSTSRRSSTKEVVSEEVQLLREQVQKMEQQLKQFRDLHNVQGPPAMLPAHALNASHAISGPPAPAPVPVDPPKPKRDRSQNDVRRLSYQEMRQLGQDINKLPGDMIQGVIKIIQESGQPLGEDGDEVELDIEALDPPALKKLQKYVKRCLTKARKKQGRDEIDEF